MTTVSDVRFNISALFRQIENNIDLLQNELANAIKERDEVKKQAEAAKEKKD